MESTEYLAAGIIKDFHKLQRGKKLDSFQIFGLYINTKPSSGKMIGTKAQEFR